MRALIRENGHLVLEGTESVAELREALLNLHTHTIGKCRFPALGAPIASLVQSVGELEAKSTRRKNVVSVDLSGESL